MGKILFWFVVITTLLFVARLLARGASGQVSGRKARREAPPSPAAKADMKHAEAMVRCEHCGIHLPRSEAFLSNGQTWCGPEHARLGQRKT